MGCFSVNGPDLAFRNISAPPQEFASSDICGNNSFCVPWDFTLEEGLGHPFCPMKESSMGAWFLMKKQDRGPASVALQA